MAGTRIPSSTPTILAVDIGSSSTRAALYDHRAEPLAGLSAKRARTFRSTAYGGSEMSPEAGFRDVCACIDAVLTKAARRRLEITHIAMCSFWHSLMGIDGSGKPTTPVLGWADRRSREYSAVLKKRFAEPEVHDRTGAHFHSSFWPAKLLWLRRERADVFAKTALWMGFGDHVLTRLCGSAATSVSMASATGIFDQCKCDWDGQLLRYLKVRRSNLPPIGTERETFRLSAKYAKRWPRLRNAEVLPAIGDGAADHVGSCGIGKGKASLMVGTSAAMRVAYEGEPSKNLPKGLWSYRIDRRRVILGGALSDGGNLYEKFRRDLNVPKTAENEMRRRGAAAHGLLVLPFFFGERSTGYREDARGAMIGTNAEADNIDLLQAAMEGVAFRLAAICERLKKVGPIRTVAASGGALRDSQVWAQIIADVLGRDLTLSSTQESASRGAVLLALESLGKIDSFNDSQRGEDEVLPFHPTCHAVYRKARKQHEAAISEGYGDQS